MRLISFSPILKIVTGTGWICDIWCLSGPGFILGYENRNPEGGGSKEIHKYIYRGNNLSGLSREILLHAVVD